MFSEKGKFILIIISVLFFSYHSHSQSVQDEKNEETLRKGIEILRTYFFDNENWKITQPELGKQVGGLVHFIEDESIDDIINYLEKARLDSGLLVNRLPENVEDSLSVPGYITAEQSKTGAEKVGIDFQSEFNELSVRIPFNVIDDA
ncbi:MAG: hypothetical protein R3182_05290, partial [Draconibacterium sp.]|nr:hypothetical protein [Draconibacterium sp.]